MRALGWGAAAFLLLCASSARAESAVGTLGAKLTQELGKTLDGAELARGGTFVACSPLRSGEPLHRAEELARRVCRAVAGKLPGTRLLEDPQSVQAAWKRAGTASRLIYVDLELLRGELRGSLDVHARSTNFWDRLKGKKPAPVAHAFASAAIDAEVRSFLPSLSLEEASLHPYKLGGLVTQALSCGEFGDRPGNSLAVLTARELVVGRLVHGAFVPERRTNVADLGARTPVGVRPPLANVVATGDWEHPIAVGSSERQGAVLDRALVPFQFLAGVPFQRPSGLACATVDAAQGGFLGLPQRCSEGARATKGDLYDVLAFAPLVSKEGASSEAWAARDASGKLTLDVAGSKSVVEAVGAQVSLGDLDQDGALDVVYTLDGPDDAIAIATHDGKALRLRKRFPTKAPVTALAICPPDGFGPLAVAAVVGDEVWIVR